MICSGKPSMYKEVLSWVETFQLFLCLAMDLLQMSPDFIIFAVLHRLLNFLLIRTFGLWRKLTLMHYIRVVNMSHIKVDQ